MQYKSPIGVGFIGAGRISDLHAIEYLNNPASQIRMICDRKLEAARAKATSWGLPDIAVTDDLEELLSDPRIDLVEILLPHDLHYCAAQAAMKAGKAVSLQKPMCLSQEEAVQLANEVADYDRPFKVFENFLFFPPIQKARKLVESGVIGRPLSIRIKSNPGMSETEWNVPRSALTWRQEKTSAGGGPLIFDDGHHKFAIAWAFMGNPSDVHAFIGSTRRNDGFVFDAQSIVTFTFPGNRIGNLEVVYSPELEIATRHYAQDDRVEITGSRGIIWINCGHGRLKGTPPLALYSQGTYKEFSDLELGWEQSFVQSTRHYLDVLLNGGTPILTAKEGLQIIRFSSAAEQSARERRIISLD